MIAVYGRVDRVKGCGTMLFLLTAFLMHIITVSGLECYSCNSLGVGDSHSNDACVKFDKSKVGTEPCQVPDGKVGKCQVFKGSVTIDPIGLGPQTAAGTYRTCAVFNKNAVPENGCYTATDIPNDFLGNVFSIATFFGADKAVDGTTCYCSKERCNVSNGTAPSTFSLVNLMVLLVLCFVFIWSM